MRIGFDTKDLLSGGHRAGAHFLELLPELLAQAHDDDELWVYRSSDDEDTHLAWLLRDEKLHQLNAPFRGRRSGGLWRSLSFPAVERLVTPPGGGNGALDACHSIHPPLMPSRAGAKILTLHQLEGEPDDKLPAVLKRSLQSSNIVVTTSRSLEEELVSRVRKNLPKKADSISAKTRVIHPGVHDRYRSSPKPIQIETLCELYPVLNEPYLLAAGGASDIERSVPFLADACSAAAAVDPSLPPLVILAEKEQSQAIIDLLSERTIGGRLLVVHELTIETLPALYRGAEMLLYPAFDFAFGLSVAEAAASGIPSITGSACGAIEILGDTTFQPQDQTVESWSKTIVEVHQDPGARHIRGRLAKERVDAMHWRTTAEEHWRLYRGQA